MNWLDFSGAPAMLIPERTARSWAGVGDADWCDYNRACALAWPGLGIIQVADSTGFVFYSESDIHTWVAEAEMYASGGWIPSRLALDEAAWEDKVQWEAVEENYLLVNSAEDLRRGIPETESISVRLSRSVYCVEYCHIADEYLGQFSRLRRVISEA